MIIAALLAILAGVLTTLTGAGGGLILLLGLAALYDPHSALSMTAPALLVGNLHRCYLYRDQIDGSRARIYLLGTIPGAAIGGVAVAGLHATGLRVIIFCVVGLAIIDLIRGQFFGKSGPATGLRRLPVWALLGPGGTLVGMLSAVGGGAGLLAAPLLLASGLHGRAYVATAATGAAAIHITRGLAYASGGLMSGPLLLAGLALAIGLMVGNLLGDRLRPWLTDDWTPRLEVGVVVVSFLLAAAS